MDAERTNHRTDHGSTTLTEAGEKVRLTITFPNGTRTWVEWTPDDARAIRDGLSTWLGE